LGTFEREQKKHNWTEDIRSHTFSISLFARCFSSKYEQNLLDETEVNYHEFLAKPSSQNKPRP